jgi:hypothetical protein
MASGELPVNFSRPERSGCLLAFRTATAPEYVEALSLIRAGQAALVEHPRAEMPGFQPCIADQKRLDTCRQRQQVEDRVWQALRENRKIYESNRNAADLP